MSKRFSNPCLKLVRNVEFDCWSIGVDRSMGWDKPWVTNKVKTKKSLIILSPNSITCSLFSSLLRNGETTGCYDCIYSQKVRRSVASWDSQWSWPTFTGWVPIIINKPTLVQPLHFFVQMSKLQWIWFLSASIASRFYRSIFFSFLHHLSIFQFLTVRETRTVL